MIGSMAPNTQVSLFGAAERLLVHSTDRLATLNSNAFMSAVLDELESEGLMGKVRVLSFDVFDTVLLRNEKSELRRFWEIANELTDVLPDVDPLDLLIARLTATRAGYRSSRAREGYREGEIEDIHRASLALLGIAKDLAAEMVAVELGYELRNLTANPAVTKLLSVFPDARYVVASNMYLSSGHIRFLLERLSLAPECAYSSTEEKVSKNDTRLLARVQQDLGFPPDAFLHVGDSHKSDFVPSKRLGWAAQLWPIPSELQTARRADALSCVGQLENQGLALGSLATHFVENA